VLPEEAEDFTVEPAVPPDMVLIPAGEFEMGSNSGESGEKPVHSVYVDAFYLDKYEVTNAQYAVFLNEMGKDSEGGLVWYDAGDAYARIALLGGSYKVMVGYENHPVEAVSWYGAMAYAAWAGKRLPTEAEWEKAARGGLAGQKYPWGNAAPNGTQCNFADRNFASDWSDKTADDGYQYTAPIGSYPPNGYGLYDMAGNVWEWCLDEWDSDFYAVSAARNPLSGAQSLRWLLNNYTGVKSLRVLRGGSWVNDARSVRVAFRSYSNPSDTGYNPDGFRCARAVSP